jgi:hypothetical protein
MAATPPEAPPALPLPQPELSLESVPLSPLVAYCLWVPTTTALRTTPLFRIKVLLLAEQENLASGRLVTPYAGWWDCIRRVYRTEGARGFWRGGACGWFQSVGAHLSNIPLFYGCVPFDFLRRSGVLTDAYLHGVLYAMLFDLLLYPVELAALCLAADVTPDPAVCDPAAHSNSFSVDKPPAAPVAEPSPEARQGKPIAANTEVVSFFRSTYRAHGLGGLYTGYAFTFSRAVLRWVGHVIVISPLFEQRQEAAVAVSIVIGVLSHITHVVHTRYTQRALRPGGNAPYASIAHCLRAIRREGVPAFLRGLSWAVAASVIDNVLQACAEVLFQ